MVSFKFVITISAWCSVNTKQIKSYTLKSFKSSVIVKNNTKANSV